MSANVAIPHTVKLSELEGIDLFANLGEDEMRCDIDGEIVSYPAGEIMWREGDEARYFMVVMEGTFQVYRIIRGQRLFISNFYKGMTGGELPLLAGTPHPGNCVAVTDVTLFRISEDNFWRLLSECVTVRRRILANMAERSQEMNVLSYQREKLVSLGTMAAGLAHELNNPASAAKRTSQNLLKTLDEFDQHSSDILKNVLFKEKNSAAYPFTPIFEAMSGEGVKLNLLVRSRQEDELALWMEEQGVEDAWEIAATLIEVGLTKEVLAPFSETLVPEQVVNFLRWMHKEVEMRLLVSELWQSTARISDLVAAVKAYSYMDQDVQIQPTDLPEGIDNTLIILNHRLKSKSIKVVKQYGVDIPLVAAYGSELNQVWTNLLDNAIDAVPEKGGVITVKTYLDHSCVAVRTVAVEIEDNGSGIPEDIQKRIFEPFFTTKGVGQGTGLGLEIAHRIVVNRHKGDIEVYSQTGSTRFIVYLPVEPISEPLTR